MTPKYDETTKTWFIKFRYKDWQGKVHDTTRRGFKLKRDAVAFAEEFKNRMETPDTQRSLEITKGNNRIASDDIDSVKIQFEL